MAAQHPTEDAPETQVHVWKLSAEVTEESLCNLFARCGRITYVNILNSALGRRGRGGETLHHAYLTFETPDQVSAALSLSGNDELGQPIFVTSNKWKRDPEANLFVKNFPSTFTSKNLEELFSSFGTVHSAEVSIDQAGLSKGYGFVQFLDKDDAIRAAETLQGQDVGGNMISISKFVPKKELKVANKANLYVRGFGREFTDRDLSERFAEFGTIKSAVVFHTDKKGKPVDFGMVCYASRANATAATAALHGRTEHEITWFIEPYMDGCRRPHTLRHKICVQKQDWKNRDIVVMNLHVSIDEAKLQSLFSEFGVIENVKILKKAGEDTSSEQPSSGVGLICFKEAENAKRAKTEMNQKTVEGRKITVVRWLPKNELARKKLTNKRKRAYARTMALEATTTAATPAGTLAPTGPHLAVYRGRVGRGRGGRGRGGPISAKMLVTASAPETVSTYPVDMEKFSTATQEDQKLMLGEALHRLVGELTNDDSTTGKITGMLLELDSQEVLELLADAERLKSKVSEAEDLLRQ
jgi:polyadenylate-binding protein